jgi:hypothetical protein
MPFALTRLRAHDRNYGPMLDAIAAAGDATLAPAVRWGAFAGLFGLASNELFLLTHGDSKELDTRLQALEAVAFSETLSLEATVRPVSAAPPPLSREGLYVFRFFEVANADVEEIAGLSKQAWESFENAGEYAAEPLALFCEAGRAAERGQMLLLTWYDGFDSWMTSRRPDPKAWDLFVRRHAMTASTMAYATRLVPA